MQRSMATPAGQRNKQLIFQVKTVSQDSELNTVETWTDWRTVWGAVVPENSSVYYRLHTANPEITIAFIVGYNSNIAPQMRIKYKNRYYSVLGVINPQESNMELWITAKGVA